MADASDTFNNWLTEKLQSLNSDEVVYGNYIRAILDGNETEDEKSEALESVIAGITDENISEHVKSILVAYEKLLPEAGLAEEASPAEDVDVRLAKMMESQVLPTTTQRSYTAEELRIREAILAQYSQMSDGEEEEGDGDEDGAVASSDCGIEKNTNAATILQQQREMREKAKLESQKKKEKDKEDREKQKQLKEEKKEKRKTTKGERRR